MVQSEKGLFKAFQVWGGAFISSANDNKSFVVNNCPEVWAVHYLISLWSQSESRYMKNNLLCSALVLVNIKI